MNKPRSEQQQVQHVLLCVLLSVLLHLLLAALLLSMPRQELTLTGGKGNATPQRSRTVKLVKKKEQKKSPAEQEQEEPKFAKTNPDTPQQQPQEPDYIGKHDTRAASAPDAKHLQTQDDAPAMTGEKKEELVTFDQTAQDGDIKHDGKRSTAAISPQQQPAPQATAASESTPAPPPAPGLEAAPDDIHSTDLITKMAKAALTSHTVEESLRGDLKLREAEKEEAPWAEDEKNTHPALRGMPDGDGLADNPRRHERKRRKKAVFYDPSLAAHRQAPGFRTYERRTRSSGRFILGSGAALNVAATARGRYEAEIYRRIAYFWYRACAEHRGDIIPGSITISLRLNKHGRLVNMDLINRRGASVSQQSFTFRAIRQASLPPMPGNVQKEMVGKLLELIYEFHFD